MNASALAVVGRDKELSVVAAFLEARGELPATLLLEGEAGIGKSTVWRQGVDLARANGFHVLEARPSERETALSFAGLGDLLGEVVSDVLRELPSPQRRPCLASSTQQMNSFRANGVMSFQTSTAVALLGPVTSFLMAGSGVPILWRATGPPTRSAPLRYGGASPPGAEASSSTAYDVMVVIRPAASNS